MGRYYYDKNSITNSTCDVICHQVNCRGAMNSGVAKAVREKWPEVYVNYKFWCDVNAAEDLLGREQMVLVEHESDRYVVNMFAQLNYGYDGKRYTSYDAFWNCLNELKQEMPEGATSIAFPYKIGCVRGGAEWEIIQLMIEKVFAEEYDICYYYLDDNILENLDSVRIWLNNKEEQRNG